MRQSKYGIRASISAALGLRLLSNLLVYFRNISTDIRDSTLEGLRTAMDDTRQPIAVGKDKGRVR